MAKKVWISIPLVTACEANDPAVISFLKGGKKKLEVETATFITKWMSDKGVPFHIDAQRSSPERSPVVAPASQGASDGATVPIVAETNKAVAEGDVVEHSAGTEVEQTSEGATAAAEPAGEQMEVVTDEPNSQLDAPGGVGPGRARGKAKRRVPEASNA